MRAQGLLTGASGDRYRAEKASIAIRRMALIMGLSGAARRSASNTTVKPFPASPRRPPACGAPTRPVEICQFPVYRSQTPHKRTHRAIGGDDKSNAAFWQFYGPIGSWGFPF